MPVPKRKTSRIRQRRKLFANERISIPAQSKCSSCGKLKHASYKSCPYCGNKVKNNKRNKK